MRYALRKLHPDEILSTLTDIIYNKDLDKWEAVIAVGGLRLKDLGEKYPKGARLIKTSGRVVKKNISPLRYSDIKALGVHPNLFKEVLWDLSMR